MNAGTRSLLVEGGASHTWLAVADRQRVRAQEWLPAVNRVGGSAGAQRSLLADIARVAASTGEIRDAYFAVGAAVHRLASGGLAPSGATAVQIVLTSRPVPRVAMSPAASGGLTFEPVA